MKRPQHYLTDMQEVILFYNGLDVPTQQILDSKGVIPTKTAADAKVAIQEMAEFSQKWHNGTSLKTRSTKTSDGLAAIQAQLKDLGQEIKKVNEKEYPSQMNKVLQERGFRSMSSSTKTNPRDQVKLISTAKADSSEICRIGCCPYVREAQDVKILEAYDHTLPQKEKDPGSFNLPCFIHNICFNKALVDLGASVSVMPFSTYTNLGLEILSHTRLTIELADRTIKQPRGIAKNVLVRIGKFIFPIDFIILDIPEDDDVPLIVGRPFLSTTHSKIDVYKRKITLRAGKEKLVFKSVKPAASIIKRVFMLKHLDLKTRIIGEGDESFDPIYEQTATGKEISNPLIADSLLKTIRDDKMLIKTKGQILKSSNKNALDRFQKLISQLEVHAAPIGFLSSKNTSSTNEVSTASGNFGVNTAGGTSSTSQVSSTPGADEVVCSFFAQQTTSPLLDNEGAEIHSGDCRILISKENNLFLSSDEEITPANDRFSKADGYHAVPPPITGNFLTQDETVGKTNEVNIKKPKSVHESVVPKPKINKDKVIIEDWNSDDEDDVSAIKISPEPKLKTVVNTGQRVIKLVWDNAKRVNQQKFSNNLKYAQTRRTFVPSGVLTRTGLVNPVRPNGKRAVNTVSMPWLLLMLAYLVLLAYGKTYGVKNMTTAGTRAVVNTGKGKMDNALKKSRGQSKKHSTRSCSGGYKITGKGKIRTANLDFDDVYFVEELKFNLFSVSQMCDKKNSVLFTDTECLILSPSFKLLDESQVVLRAPRQNDVYSLDLKNIVPFGGITCLYAHATTDESELWHKRLGHVNFKNLNKLVKGHLVRGLPSKVFVNDHTCVACKKGKRHKATCKAKLVRTIRKPLELLYMDLFRHVSIESINKKKYCLVVTDDFSRFSWVFFLATKDETNEILYKFITGLENQLNHKVKIIRSDHGTEFKNHAMNEFYAKKGIKMEFSVARTPQQNGTIRILCLQVHPGKDKTYSGITYFNPIHPHRPRIPVEEVVQAAQEKPSENAPKDYDVQDLEDVAEKEEQHKLTEVEQALKDDLEKLVSQEVAAKAMDDATRQAFEEEKRTIASQKRATRATSINKLNTGRPSVSTANTPYVSAASTPTCANAGESSFVYLGGQIPIDASTLPNADLPTDPNMPDLEDDSDVFPNEGMFSGAYDDEDVGADADFNNMDNTIDVSPIPTLKIHKDHPKEEPKNISQALQDESWAEAMQEELLQFKLQKFWVLVDLPSEKKVIGTKWVFRNKRDERSVVVKNKARLVAQGFRQEEGIEYDKVFAPVARLEAIRLFLAFASYMGFTVYQMDVKSALLYGTIGDEVYVYQPLGFVDPAHLNKVYKVIKALYGLHQAPRAWYETLSSFLLENGFRRGTIDKTLFIKKNKSDIMLIQVNVDDIIFGSTKQSMCTECEECMHKRFQMSSMGELIFFLGLQVKQQPDGIFISQDKYVADILKKFDFWSIRTATTPNESNKPLVQDEERWYVLSQPKSFTINAVKRIFRYLKHQPKLGLWYPRDSPFELEAFSDSDYGGASLDKKSTTDLLTKGFDVSRFNFLVVSIGMMNLSSMDLRMDESCAGSFSHIWSMANLKYSDKHNMVAFLKKPTESVGFTEIVDFLKDTTLRYALSHNPTISDSLVKQFWQTATVRTLANGTQELVASIDTKEYTITEASVRSKLQLADAAGISNLPDAKIYDGLATLGPNSGGWDQFGSTIATALICLSSNRVYNFSKMIFDGMVHNLESSTKILMYPRFLQIILDITTENKGRYLASTLTKKLFANIKRGYAGEHVPLLSAMLAGAAEDQGEGSANPAEPHPTPIDPVPSTSQPPIPSTTEPLQQPSPPRHIDRQEPEIPQSQGPTPTHVADEATTISVEVNAKEAATTTTGLDAGLDSGNIHESPLRSHEAPLHEGHTSGNAEDRLQLKELMEIIPKLVTRIDDLEKELHQTKNTYGKAVLTLVERVKSLEKALKRKTKKMVVFDSEDEEPEDQGRKIQDIDDDPLVSLVRESMKEKDTDFVTPTKVSASGEAQESEISPTILEAAKTLSQVASQTISTYKRRVRSTDKGKDINTGLDAEAEINTGSEDFNTGSIGVNTGSRPVSTPSVVQTINVTIPSPVKSQREGKAPMTTKDVTPTRRTKAQIQQEKAGLAEAMRLQALQDEEAARQVHLDALLAKRISEEEELSEQQKKRKAEVLEAAQYYTEEDWDIIRAKHEANAKLTKSLQGESVTDDEFAKRMMEMINQKKKYYAEQKAKARRSKPITQAQQREYISTFIKNKSSWKLTQLKKLTFEELKDEFEKLMKNIERFVPMESDERVKRQGVQLEQESSKKQKTIEDVPEEKVKDVKEEEIEKSIKKRGKRRKQLARKGIHVNKTAQSGTEEREAYMKEKSQILHQIIRANGADKVYMSFGAILKDFSRDDLTELYRLVIKKYGANRPEEAYDRVLWGDLKTMFDPPLSEDTIWSLPLQQKMVNWRYYDSCAVYCLTLEACTIYMLADRKYPLSKDAWQAMLNMKLQGGAKDEVCYQLLKMIEKEAGIRWSGL
ncbi:putative ribonuclease H-like domain-containing protein [Tanacetum coccineum]